MPLDFSISAPGAKKLIGRLGFQPGTTGVVTARPVLGEAGIAGYTRSAAHTVGIPGVKRPVFAADPYIDLAV
jgi:hypothetical protein